MEKIKEDLESYQQEKSKVLERIAEKDGELKDLCKFNAELKKKIETKYKETGSKCKGGVAKAGKGKPKTSDSVSSQLVQEETKIYFSSHETSSSESSFREPIPTGKFRERTTNSNESERQKLVFQDEIIEFSSNNDEEEVEFELSSDGGTARSLENY